MKKLVLTSVLSVAMVSAPVFAQEQKIALLKTISEQSSSAPASTQHIPEIQLLSLEDYRVEEVVDKAVELTSADLSFAFDNHEHLDFIAMTDKQMAETEGAILPLVAFALVGGAAFAWKNHHDSYQETGSFASAGDTLKATGEGMLAGATLYGGGRMIKPHTGSVGNWIRKPHDSYSQSMGKATKSISWGSNAHHRKNIGNETLRDLNAKLRDTKLPGNSWRVKDPGHFHIKIRKIKE